MDAIEAGASLVVLDRAVSAKRIPVSTLLATGAVHHHLIKATRAPASASWWKRGKLGKSTTFVCLWAMAQTPSTPI